jgi:hypothetical protein
MRAGSGVAFLALLVALGASPARAETVTVVLGDRHGDQHRRAGGLLPGRGALRRLLPGGRRHARRRPSPTAGDYEGATSFRFEIGDDVITAPTGFVEVGDGELLGGNVVDFYRGALLCQEATCVGSVGNFLPLELELVLVDSSASLYSDDALPGDLSPADFDAREAFVSFANDVTSGGVTASVDTLTLVVPEPGAPLLLGAGERPPRRARAAEALNGERAGGGLPSAARFFAGLRNACMSECHLPRRTTAEGEPACTGSLLRPSA